MRATIKDVAAAAGVSTKTVSRVLKGERYVGADTREKVAAAAAALGFATDGHDGDRTGAAPIALLFDPSEAQAMAPVLAGIRARLGDRPVVAVACGPDGAGAVAALVDASPIGGAVLLPPLAADRAVLHVLEARGVRAVVLAGTPGGGPSVGIDEARAAAVMTRHLLALGHRRIGFVDDEGVRETGHRIALAAAGIADEPALFVRARHDFAAGARAAAQLFELADPPTAVFAGSDTIAAGVLTAAHARGLRVPEDVSVAGFGDEALAAYVWPPLTTMRVSAQETGAAAAVLLLADGDARREVHFELVERASVIGIGI